MPPLTKKTEPLLSMVNGRPRRSVVKEPLMQEPSSKQESSPPAVQPVEDDIAVDAPPESTDESDGEGGSTSTRGNLLSSFITPRAGSRKEAPASSTASGRAQDGHKPRKSPERKSRRISDIKPSTKAGVEDISDDEADVGDVPERRPTRGAGISPLGSHLEGLMFRHSNSHKYSHDNKSVGPSRAIKRKTEEPQRKVRAPKERKGPGLPGTDADSSPKTKTAQFIMPAKSQAPDTPTGARFKSFDAAISPPSADGKKISFKASAIVDSPVREPARFNMVDLDIEGDEGSTGLQTEPEVRSRGRAQSISSSSSLTELDSLSSGLDLCPMCDAPMDADLLDGLSAITMSIAKQQKICQLHKRREANAQWKEKGYPTIDWDALESRFERQHDYLDRVLKAESASYYREAYSRKVESGKGRTLLTSEKEVGGTLTPGYYGFRGARLMSEWLIRRFSAPLRRRAVKDRLVAARGHTTYVQSVLVPELAARLVAEDLDVGPEAARDVLRDSARLGELVHEEIKDVVRDHPDDDEDDF